MTYSFSSRSQKKLEGVNSSLVKVIQEAIKESPLDFGISEGLRTWETQKIYFENGKSRTMNSKHLIGRAVDIVVLVEGKASWNIEHYKIVADHIKAVANRLGVPITWGGDWKSFLDGPHFELVG